jgi:hypothetical protein
MVILYHSIIGASMAQNDLNLGELSRSEREHRKGVILECEEVFLQASTFPGVGLA